MYTSGFQLTSLLWLPGVVLLATIRWARPVDSGGGGHGCQLPSRHRSFHVDWWPPWQKFSNASVYRKLIVLTSFTAGQCRCAPTGPLIVTTPASPPRLLLLLLSLPHRRTSERISIFSARELWFVARASPRAYDRAACTLLTSFEKNLICPSIYPLLHFLCQSSLLSCLFFGTFSS